MMKLFLFWLFVAAGRTGSSTRDKMSQTAPLEQVYGETVEDDALLPMNELDMDFGYASMRQTLMWKRRIHTNY